MVFEQRLVAGAILFGIGQGHLQNGGRTEWLLVFGKVTQFADGGRAGEGAFLVAARSGRRSRSDAMMTRWLIVTRMLIKVLVRMRILMVMLM